MSGPAFFIADDAENEPTLWQVALEDWPRPVLRRCDLRAGTRDAGWAFITAAVGPATTVDALLAIAREGADHAAEQARGSVR